MVDAPGGGGKIPVMPNYVVTQSADRVVLRNYEGFITAYTQPEEYKRHDPATCPDCQKRAKQSGEAGQEGLAGLLAGERMSIAPEGFNTVHQRLSN